MANRPCLGIPDLGIRCGRIVRNASRCDEHRRTEQRRRDAVRGTPTERGYTSEYWANRRRLLAGGPYACAWGCGRLATTADHLLPLARGGSNDLSNLVPACGPCNSSRGSRMDWRPGA